MVEGRVFMPLEDAFLAPGMYRATSGEWFGISVDLNTFDRSVDDIGVCCTRRAKELLIPRRPLAD